MIFVRWRKDQSRRGRVFPPLPPDHPSVNDLCWICDRQIGTAVATQLIAIGPINDENRHAHSQGRWYSAGAVLLHHDCAQAMTNAALDLLAMDLIPVEESEGSQP